MLNFAACLVERLGKDSCLIDAPAGEIVTAPEIADAVAGFAAGFLAAGLGPGDRVMIGCALTPASSLAYLGAIYAGLVPVPVDERALEPSGAAIFSKAGASALWTDKGAHCNWASQFGGARLEGRLDKLQPQRVPAAPCDESDLAILVPTSGSTGFPHLVKVTHGNLIANTEAIVRSQQLRSDERAMLILPLSYCFGASVLHTHLHQGGGVVFDSRFMFPDKVLRAITQHGCTTFAGVPTVYNILLRRSNIRSIPLTPLRRLLQAGGSLASERVRDLSEIVPHAEFFVMYGQTEATARISCLPPSQLMAKQGSVGLPLDNLQVRIVDDAGLDAAVRESGEVWVSGRSVCSGYFDDTAATAERFRGRWLLTGDIAYRDEDGYLWIVGRKNEFIKMRGVRMSFAEIEARMAAVPGVSECAVTAVAHPESGEALAVYIVAEAGATDLMAGIRREMPVDWVCDSINVVAELPKNSHGKVARAVLRELVPLQGGKWAHRSSGPLT